MAIGDDPEKDWLAGTPAVARVTPDAATGLFAVVFTEHDDTETVALLDREELRAVTARLQQMTAELRATGRARLTIKEAVVEVIGRDPWQ